MLFSSIPFLFYFLPAVVIVYFLISQKLKNAFLLLASLLFYAWGEPRYVFLMAAAILLFYFYGIAVERSEKRKKLWLGAAVFTGVAMLAVFKYADFALDNWNRLTGMSIPLLRFALPIGISFYTFQCISYVIDVYRGHTKAQKNIINFGTYVSLFPQLIAGPIVRYVDVEKELVERKTDGEDFSDGLFLFLIGLGKKVLIANAFGQLTETFRASQDLSVLFFWLYAISFTLHIYFDFSGYSDMAIGLGRIFGFRFPRNFDYPYTSKSITEFWRRWHMTLGGWFRDYVYIPLGGNRVSKGRWVVNILAVWMLTGLWHGAAWNFVVWGLLFAAMLLMEKWVPFLQKLPTILRRVYVLLVVIISFVIFNANTLTQAGRDIAGMFGFLDVPLVSTEALYCLRSYAVLFVVGIVGATPLVRNTAHRLGERSISAVLRPVIAAALLLICTAFLVDGSFNPFLYFRF
ncbi:MAG: MBOAT family protein [Oscillospiraceae bacterium]|nr:MBOAT family protein [Oscillospiraceae bacterium]